MPNVIRVAENFIEVATRSIDSRNRLSITEAANSMHKRITRFRIFQGSDGDVLLRPVIEVPVQELWLHQNPQAREMVVSGIRESAEGKARNLDDSLLATPDE